MTHKFACVHGHFYQPPRENPWLDAVEPEDSAHPYHDWNERIFEECYGPNAACPVIGDDGLIVGMADNYRKMSFNFSPTLLSWLERRRPEVYARIIQADVESAKANNGHGNAIAQPFYHAILPLQTLRDKRTLVRWGLEDFRRRFGRPAEGLWLPETGVDDETLEVLVEHGLRFTVLSPRQAARVREASRAAWQELDGAGIVATRPYRWPSKAQPGRGIAVFFYDHGLHERVVSGEAFARPDTLARSVLDRFRDDASPQLVSVATDGEFYGHHHKPGASALARTFLALESAGVQMTNYAAFLERFPPPQEVKVKTRTAWSCAHGLGRWTQDCGCRSERLKAWKQGWRGPMRAALDWLADECDDLFARRGATLFKDPWAARDGYVLRLLDRSEGAAAQLLAVHAAESLPPRRVLEALRLLEMQRHRLAMFTSCGWFFDDVSGLEAAQCLKHAARAAELAGVLGSELSGELRGRLKAAPSNVKEFADGAAVYERLAEPSRTGSARACAHLAIVAHLGWTSSPDYAWQGEAREVERREKRGAAGRDRSLSLRDVGVRWNSTLEQLECAAIVYQRDRTDVACWLAPSAAARKAFAELVSPFENLGDPAFLQLLSERLGGEHWRLDALMPEERRDALRLLMPGPGDNPTRRVFLQGWVRALFRLRVNPASDEVLDYLLKAKAHGLAAQHLPGAATAREALRQVLDGALAAPDAAAFSRLGRWIEALEQSQLPVSVWQLRYFFWRWRQALRERAPLPGERDAALALGERLRFSGAAMPLGTAPA